MKVLADRVLILPAPIERKTASGIIIADTVTSTDSAHAWGQVVGVGPGFTTEAGIVLPLEVAVGDQVLYSVHAGHEVEIAGVAHIIVRGSDILATR